MEVNSSFAKKVGTVLSSIVASGLLGLPVLAQSVPSTTPNAAPDPASPGRSFPNQSDPRTGQGDGSLNNGVSTPPATGVPANESNTQGRPSSESRPSEDRPAESRPSGDMQRPMNQTAPMNSAPVSPSSPGSSGVQPQSGYNRLNQSSTPMTTPIARTPGITDYPNQINPLTGASDVVLERGAAVVPADGVSASSGYRFSSQVYGTQRNTDFNTVSLGQ